jgi:hypothetical protein
MVLDISINYIPKREPMNRPLHHKNCAFSCGSNYMLKCNLNAFGVSDKL